MAANVFELNVNINSTIRSEAQSALNDLTNGSLPDFIDPKNGDLLNGDDYQDAIEKMEQDMLDEDAKKAKGKQLAKATTMASAVGLGVDIMNWSHSRVSTIYKDQARANKISNATNAVSNGASFAMSVAAGYAGGPIIGTINLALQIATQALTIAKNVEEHKDKEKDWADESDYAMERLGLLAAGKGR